MCGCAAVCESISLTLYSLVSSLWPKSNKFGTPAVHKDPPVVRLDHRRRTVAPPLLLHLRCSTSGLAVCESLSLTLYSLVSSLWPKSNKVGTPAVHKDPPIVRLEHLLRTVVPPPLLHLRCSASSAPWLTNHHPQSPISFNHPLSVLLLLLIIGNMSIW